MKTGHLRTCRHFFCSSNQCDQITQGQGWKYRLEIDILYFFVIECKNSLLFFHYRLGLFPTFIVGNRYSLIDTFFLKKFFQKIFYVIFSTLTASFRGVSSCRKIFYFTSAQEQLACGKFRICTVIFDSIPKYNTRKRLRNVWSLVASLCGRQARARLSNAVVRITSNDSRLFISYVGLCHLDL